VLLAQLPNLVNFVGPWASRHRGDQAIAMSKDFAELKRAFESREIDAAEFSRRSQSLVEKQRLAGQQSDRESLQKFERTARFLNMVLPIGWLPLSVMAAAEGSFVPSVLGLLGMSLIGAASLYRAYRTTVGIYQGQPTNRKGRPLPAVTTASEAR